LINLSSPDWYYSNFLWRPFRIQENKSVIFMLYLNITFSRIRKLRPHNAF
jgi:hypothetical protein